MNRRKFIIGAAIFPVAISLPISLAISDPYDEFLQKLNRRVRETITKNEIVMDRIVIDPVANGRRLVHLYAGNAEFQWYQWYRA
jgi:hypothetical protein